MYETPTDLIVSAEHGAMNHANITNLTRRIGVQQRHWKRRVLRPREDRGMELFYYCQLHTHPNEGE